VDTERPSRTAALAARLTAARDRAETLPGAPLVREVLEHEHDLGGGLIAGGVAYRLFLWLVPLGLIVAAILSFWSDHDAEGLEDASREFGITAAFASAATEALQSSDRNVALLLVFGLVVLAWFTVGAIRALVLAHALAWQLKPPRIRRPLHAIAAFNGLFLLYALSSAALAWLKEQIGAGALLGVVFTLALTTALALCVMWLLPHRATRARELLPGALLVAGGAQLLQIAVVLYFAPRLGRSEATYGALGVAATMLVWLYVISRLITIAAFLNATLWSRARAAARSRSPDHGSAGAG
jgi:uncharacterized BrkB/YihY/UPF0761 family membrane protein